MAPCSQLALSLFAHLSAVVLISRPSGNNLQVDRNLDYLPGHKLRLDSLFDRPILTRMKTLLALLGATILCGSASAWTLPPMPDNWGPTKQGVRVSLSLDKSTYAVGEEIPLHIKAQIVSAEQPLYAIPDSPTGAFFMKWDFARAFHLAVVDEKGRVVGNDEPSNLQFIISGSSGPLMYPVPLEVGHIYSLEQSANRKQRQLPMHPGTYRLTVTWSPYPASDPPCDNSRLTSDSQKLASSLTVSSVPITIQITGNP